MVLNDIYIIAESIDSALAKTNRPQERGDGRHTITVSLGVTPYEIQMIDRELYYRTNGNMEGHNPSDEVSIEIYGINFELAPTDIQEEVR